MTVVGQVRPKYVYKYCAFSEKSLQVLILDQLWFADPSSFNDPLDSQPHLETDLPVTELERILHLLVVRRVTEEMQAAAKAIKYRGPRTMEHIDKHAHRAADKLVAEIRFNATDHGVGVSDPLQFLLGLSVERELLRRYDRGIVSLASHADCPLMWSHYGAQHQGICIGYSVPGDAALSPVKYGGSRNVAASRVRDMVDGDVDAARAVDAAVLLNKAKPWQYEKEWRLIGNRGLNTSPLDMVEVVFGMRCEPHVQYAVAKALGPNRVKFYEICQRRGSFKLKKQPAYLDELLSPWPERAHDRRHMFDEVNVLPVGAGE